MSHLPVLPLRDVVVYPYMVIPLFVGRTKSIKALEAAMAENKRILLVSQKEPQDDQPKEQSLYTIGTSAQILQLLKLPDGTVKVLVEGLKRTKIKELTQKNPYFIALIEDMETYGVEEKEAEGLLRSLMAQFDSYVKLNKKIPHEILGSLASIEQPERLADTIAAHISLKIEQKQQILEISDLRHRIESLMGLMEAEIDLLQVEKRIRTNVKDSMEKTQREYYLNEQMRAIQEELRKIGGKTSSGLDEFSELKQKIENSGMHKDAKEKALAELEKLQMMPPMSAEANGLRIWLDWILKAPWKKRSKVRHDLETAQTILDEDHYGLEKVKERIIEYLAVQERVKKIKGPILCLVGPPGVGKTSLGQSIARATNRKFVRMALGGVRDEAEIRGHRRTYIGAMPGRIVQNLGKVGVKNPLFLLDEIDKMAMDYRGDPASALLEVLDPEQNHAFADHYLEVDYDLSDVMFVCTANSLDIPGPLLDRMEVIRLSGYTEDEKLNIAMKYLLPKQRKLNGVKKQELTLEKDAVLDIIRYYTREAGVRNLDREISKIARKVVKLISLDKDIQHYDIKGKDLEEHLGVKKYRFGVAEDLNQIGQVTGLAWTQVGGEILTIEASVVDGTGKTIRTGQLGDVMQESIQAALTVVRSRADSLGISKEFYEKKDIHVHVPEGATPKDGPSAGISMCTALVSALTKIPVKADVAMTGEITLRGEVLPIGGLKEKLLAARRGGIKHAVIPHENERDLKEIPENITKDLIIHPVRWIDEVLNIALEHLPHPEVNKSSKDAPTTKHRKPKGASDIRTH